MINDEPEDFYNFDSDDPEANSLDVELVRKNIPTYNSQKLCEMIVCDRYFGCYREIAIMCMEELSTRRVAGDTFDFETYIEQSFNELPKLNIAIPDVRDVLHQIIGGKLNNR